MSAVPDRGPRPIAAACPAVAGFALVLALVALGAPALAGAAPGTTGAGAGSGATATAGSRSSGPQGRVLLLGLRPRGHLARFVRRVSNPGSNRYRRFVGTHDFRARFSARRADRRRVVRFLRGRRGVRAVELNSTRTVVLAVMTPPAARRTFCAAGAGSPSHGLCVPRRLRRAVRQISAGERYRLGGASSGAAPGRRTRVAAPPEPRRRAPATRSANGGTPSGCKGAVNTGAFTPNQLATAYGVDALHGRGLKGRGVRVATLAGQPLRSGSLRRWARCFGMPEPRAESVAMPSAGIYTATPSNEEYLDIEALASLAPRLQRITPIFVPLDQNFSHSFALFMFGALDRSRQGGLLPQVLSISDGVCEGRFTHDQLRLGQRMLREASALGISTLAASGDLGFRGCSTGPPGANFPNSSRFVAGVGGTELTLDAGNEISDEVVWSTFATDGPQGVGTGGGPSDAFARPGFQRAPGIGPPLQSGRPRRLTPDIAAMASFTPGIATFNSGQGGWGADGGTSAATPIAAAIVALASEQERRAGRPPLGSLPPLLYGLGRRPDRDSIFRDITEGTSSPKPNSAVGKTPAGGAAQPGYDLATGLGSLRAAAFADAVARVAPPGR